jgi:WD40 repeat protein
VSDDSLSDLERIDPICDLFEDAWRAGEHPCIEDHAADWEGAARAALLRELVRLDAEYRRDRGEAASPDDYLGRFPELNPAWLARALRAEAQVATATIPPVGDTLQDGPPPPGRHIGDYEVLEKIARGGMGVVFKARQKSLNRVVALKMILAGAFADADQVRRFRLEAENAASLDHPNIVPIYEVGEHDGQPFFSMKLFGGGTLGKHVGRFTTDPKAAARLMATVARAVHYAHQRGIQHRDLKPGNILLDAEGQPHVTDFGLAKRVEDGRGQTLSGAVVGTPSYMAPEQAAGKEGLTWAADVYGLGAVLYELLTGRPPFRAETPIDTILQVLEEEPVPPARRRPGVPRDLEVICLKCLSKEPGRRYASTEALADELERYLAGKPITGRPVGRVERAVKWARRRPVIAGLLTLVVLVTVTGIISMLWQYGQTVEERDRADREAEEARRVASKEKVAREGAEYQALRADHARHAILIKQALSAWERHDVAEAERVLGEVGEPFQQTWETRHLHSLCRRKAMTLLRQTGLVNSVTFSPDGQRIATQGGAGTVRVWDAATGRQMLSLKGGINGAVFSPDGRRIASGGWNGTVRVWDIQTGQEKLTLKGHIHPVRGVVFSPNGQRIASGDGAGTVRVWDAATGRQTLSLKGHTGQIYSMAISPDGRRIASGSDDGTVRVWDIQTGQEKLTLKGHASIYSVAISPDGRRIASGGDDGTVRVWDAATGRQTLFLTGRYTGAVLSVVFSPDGQRVASGDIAGTVRVWDARTGEVTIVEFGADGERIITWGGDVGVQVWDATGRQTLYINSGINGAVFSPDGQRIAAGGVGRKEDGDGEEGVVRVRDVATGREILTLKGHIDPVNSVAISPNGQHIASGSAVGTVRVWDARTGQEKLTLKGHTHPVRDLAVSPDGQRIASGSADGTVRVWDAATGQEKLTLKGHTGTVLSVVFSPDGQRIASGGEDGTIRMWDAAGGKAIAILRGHTSIVSSVAFSPDGQRIASGGGNGTVRVWDAATGRQTLSLTGHTSTVLSVVFSPDGQRIASGGDDETVRVWDAATGRQTLSLKGHRGAVWGVAFTLDGQRIGSGGQDETVRVWDAATGRQTLSLKGHTNIYSIAISPDGQRIASGGEDGTVRVWDARTGQEMHSLKGHTGRVHRVVISPDGHRIVSASDDGTVKIWDGAPLAETPDRGALPADQ